MIKIFPIPTYSKNMIDFLFLLCYNYNKYYTYTCSIIPGSAANYPIDWQQRQVYKAA